MVPTGTIHAIVINMRAFFNYNKKLMETLTDAGHRGGGGGGPVRGRAARSRCGGRQRGRGGGRGRGGAARESDSGSRPAFAVIIRDAGKYFTKYFTKYLTKIYTGNFDPFVADSFSGGQRNVLASRRNIFYQKV